MTKKIDMMEMGISLARLFRLAFKNYQVILSSFFLGLLLAYGYTTSPLMDQGTYQTTGSVAYRVSTNATVLNTIIEIVKSPAVADLAVTALNEEAVTLANGSPITRSIIQSTITAATITNSLRITMTFTHPDETIVIPVMNAVIDATIANGNANYPVIANNLLLGEYATTKSFDGPSSTLYLAIGALLGLMIGGSVGVLWDAFKGTLYSAQDIKEFGVSSFYLPLKITTQLTKDRILNFFGLGKKINFEREQTKLILQGLVPSSSFSTIQNNLESTRIKPEEPLTTLMVTPMPSSTLTMVAFAYARQSSTQGRKTILIDFDLKDVPFTKYLETYQIETKKKASSKEGVTFLSLEENLDLYLPLHYIIPAKVIRDEETQDIITQVKKKYDHIIILGPSLLPDASAISILSYVNSALIVAKASVSTTTELVKSVNLLIDNQLTAIETLVVEEDIVTPFPSLNVIRSLFEFKATTKAKPPVTPKPKKKK